MGLDTYPSRSRHEIALTPEDELALEALDLRLCEWLGHGSFRGKVYLDVVDRVAGVCLTQDWIAPGEVAAMADAFEACDPEAVARACSRDRYPVTAVEIGSLSRLFRTCAGLGLGLVGDY